jgi:thiosulfate/3-mercaptopyruvate sulfurtransferase
MKHLIFAVLCSGIILNSASARASNAAGPSKASDQLLVTADELATRFMDHAVILHITRTPESYAGEHISGARLADWAKFTEERDGIANELPTLEALTEWARELGLDQDKPIIVYDDGEGIFAARAYVTLRMIGLDAMLLDGQLKKWKADGRPLSTEPPPAHEPSTFSPTWDPDMVVDLEDMRNLSFAAVEPGGPDSALVDVRPTDQFSGEKPGKEITRGGHIPGAVNLPWDELIVSKELPVLKPKAELESIVQALGVSPDQTTVAYCRTGAKASLLVYVLDYLDYPVRLYDASFSEWSAQVDTDVATQ